MLDKPIEKIEYDAEGKVCGVTSGGETAKTKRVIADPSYFPDKVKKVGQVGVLLFISRAHTAANQRSYRHTYGHAELQYLLIMIYDTVKFKEHGVRSQIGLPKIVLDNPRPLIFVWYFALNR